jgi:hypothetical protein
MLETLNRRFETAGQAILARVAEVDMSKFADEDQEEEEEPKSYHIKPQVCGLQGLGK